MQGTRYFDSLELAVRNARSEWLAEVINAIKEQRIMNVNITSLETKLMQVLDPLMLKLEQLSRSEYYVKELIPSIENVKQHREMSARIEACLQV